MIREIQYARDFLERVLGEEGGGVGGAKKKRKLVILSSTINFETKRFIEAK